MKTNKLFTGAIALISAATMLVVGTLAWQGESSRINQMYSRSSTPPPPPTIEEKFTPGAVGTKEVTVKNPATATEPVYVRIKLSEHVDVSAGAPTDGVIPGGYVYDYTTFAHNGAFSGPANVKPGKNANFELDFGNVVSIATTGSTSPTTPTWIYDNDGWAYWSEPLAPGAETAKLLEAVALANGSTLTDYYYALKVDMQWVTYEDLGLWSGATTVAARPSEAGQSPVQPQAGTPNMRTILGRMVTAGPPPAVVEKYNYTVTGITSGQSIVEGTTLSINVTYVPKDNPSAAPATATNIIATPNPVTAGTTEVVITLETVDGSATLRYPVTVVPTGTTIVTPGTAGYEFQVISTKSGGYNAGDTVNSSDLKVQHRTTSPVGAWTDAVSVTDVSVIPTTPLTLGTNNIAVSYKVNGVSGMSPMTIVATAPPIITPGTSGYEFQVISSKTDYKAGDTVNPADLTVQYRATSPVGAWTNAASVTEIAVIPTTPLTLGTNNIAVSYKVNGVSGMSPMTINAAVNNSNPNPVINGNNGTKYQHPNDSTANSRIYEKLNAAGEGTGEYVYFTGNPANMASGNVTDADFVAVVKRTSVPYTIVSVVGDPNYTVTTPWFHQHSASVQIPIYLEGANYAQATHRGSDATFGTGDDAQGLVVYSTGQIPESQQSNWFSK